MAPPRGLLNPLPKENSEAQRGPEVSKVTHSINPSSPVSLLSLACTFKACKALSCPLQAIALHLGTFATGGRQGSGFYDPLHLRRSPHKSQDSGPAPLKRSQP